MRLLLPTYTLIGLLSGSFPVSRAFLPVCNTRASESNPPRLDWKFHERDKVKSRHEGIPCSGSTSSKRARRGTLAFHFPCSDSSHGRRKGPLQCTANGGDQTAEKFGRSEVSLDTATTDPGVPSSLASSDSNQGTPVVHSKADPPDGVFKGKLGSNIIVSDLMNGVLGGLTTTPRRADGTLWIDGRAALWVVHSIITVDAGIWRGWTFQETLMRIPWDNWGSYETGLTEHPVITKTGINVIIYLLGDWLSQVNWGRDEDRALWEFDLARTLRNGFIGALFGPVVHYYYEFSDFVLPPSIPVNRPFKIVMDQSAYFCTKCAVYIALVSLLRGDSVAVMKETVKEKVPGVVTTGWRFWPFVHIFTYFVVPPRHRVLWVNCVDLLWNSILAGMTSAASTAEAESSELGGTGQQGKGESTKSSQVVAVTTGGQAEPKGR